jgi:hypothetical protein
MAPNHLWAPLCYRFGRNPCGARLEVFHALGDAGCVGAGSGAGRLPWLREPVIDPGDGGNYAVNLDPADFVATIANPWLPFIPWSRWLYQATPGDATRWS